MSIEISIRKKGKNLPGKPAPSRTIVGNRFRNGHTTGGNSFCHLRLNRKVIVPLDAILSTDEDLSPIQDRLKRSMIPLPARHLDIHHRIAEALNQDPPHGRKESRLILLIVRSSMKRSLTVALPVIDVRSFRHNLVYQLSGLYHIAVCRVNGQRSMV